MTHAFRTSRRGFTLIEILVVIAIIVILASLSAWGVVAVIGNQKANNTIATVKVVNKVLQSHWQYVIEEAKKDARSGLISPAVTALAQPDPTNGRAQVLWIKFRLMEAFPQSYADVLTPFVYSTDPNGNMYIPPSSQQRYITAYQKSLATPPFVAANNNSATQSAACLLMALSVNRGGITLTQDQIGYAIADSDSDGVKELVDGWSPRSPLVPIKFTRFDTTPSFTTSSQGLQIVNPAAAGSKNATFADPVDPDGTLLSPAWYNATNIYEGTYTARTFYEAKFQYGIETSVGSGAANYVIPSIISAGKDGVFGTQDDIISSILRQEQPMEMYCQPRRAFTLVELLVVMFLIAILATLAIAFFPNAASSQVEARAGQQVQSWLTIAKQRAMRDQAPRGVRLWINNTTFYAGANLLTNVVTDCQYIEQPPDFPGGSGVTMMTGLPTNAVATYAASPLSCVMIMPPGNMSGSSGVLTNGATTVTVPNVPTQSEFWSVQPGDYLEVLGTGLMHQVVQVGIPSSSSPAVTPNVDYVVVAPPLPYQVFPTANFRILRAPRVTGDDSLKMPDGTIIDLNTNAAYGNPLPAPNTTENGTTNYVDILFSPTGEVISTGVANSNLNLWVRSPNNDDASDPFRGAPTIISVFTKTGFVGAYPPSSGTPTTPYLLIK